MAGMTLAMRALATRDIVRLALDADEAAAQPLGRRAGRARAEEGVQRPRSPGLDEARITRCSSASGFCVGCAFWPSAPLIRSSPVHSASVQSERICSSSLAIFMAS